MTASRVRTYGLREVAAVVWLLIKSISAIKSFENGIAGVMLKLQREPELALSVRVLLP